MGTGIASFYREGYRAGWEDAHKLLVKAIQPKPAPTDWLADTRARRTQYHAA